MNNEILSKALETAKAVGQTVGQTVGETIDKGKDQVAQRAPELGEAAKHGLATAAETARAVIHSAAKAISEATEPKPPAPPAG